MLEIVVTLSAHYSLTNFDGFMRLMIMMRNSKKVELVK